MDLICEVLGPDAAPVIGAGRPQPSPSAPTPIPAEQIAAYAASWLLRLATRPDLHAPGPALRVAAILGHREAAQQPSVGGRELAAFLGQRTAEDGLRGLRIAGLVRMEPRDDDRRGVVYRPAGQMRPARGALADARRLNWLRWAATDPDLPDAAVRLALLVGAAWGWEVPVSPPEAGGLAGRLGVAPDEVVAGWAALIRAGLLHAGVDRGGHPTLRIVDRSPTAGRANAEGEA